jgi:DNA-binding protein YbaB
MDELDEMLRGRERTVAALSEERVSGRSSDGLATVVVDGNGELIEVELDAGRFVYAGSAGVARAVLDALASADRAVAAAAGARWSALLPPETRRLIAC